MKKAVFPGELKHADIKPIYSQEVKRKIIHLYVLYQIYLTFFNVVCMINLNINFLRYCQNISADSEKSLANNIAY